MRHTRDGVRSFALSNHRPLDRRALLRRSAAIGLGAAAIPLIGPARRSGISAAQQDAVTPSAEAESRTPGPVELLIDGYDAPEGPAFDKEGNLYFVDSFVSAIVKVTPDGKGSEFFNTGGIPAGLAFHPDGSLYVADEGAEIHGILRITADGTSGEIVVNTYEGAPLNGANDLVFDADGVLYFSDPWDAPGGFYRYFPDGTLEQLDYGLQFPNGVALTADGSAVILAESGMNRLLRYTIAADGTVGQREIWTTLDGDFAPDGMAFDENGDLYVAHYGGGHVDVIDPTGATVEQILVSGAEVTNVAFGGEDNKTLVITDVTSHAVHQVRMSVAGQPLHDGRN
jgi:gluconolactonase